VKVKKDRDFSEEPNGESTCADIFYSDRKDVLHVDFENIEVNQLETKTT
jgi:hypothetical protein